jgi:hypothetical protein
LPPETITQRNVLAATGIPPETFLELLRERSCPLHITRVGKLRMVDRAPFLAWLRTRTRTDAPETTVHDLAAELGLQRVA